MPKFLILKHYNGGPTPAQFAPMSKWTPEEVDAHIEFQRHVVRLLQDNGEFVDAQALSPEGSYVQYGGKGNPPVLTDGPFPESKELIAGWFIVDVDSVQRANEIAAYVSSAPGPGGEPIYEWLEVRPVMVELPSDSD